MRAMVKRDKGQSSMDYMVTYGWVILVLAAGFIAISYMGAFNPPVCQKTRYGFSQVTPLDWALYVDKNVFRVQLENRAGTGVRIEEVYFSAGDVVCANASSVVVSEGNATMFDVNCSESPGAVGDKFITGSCFSGTMTVYYVDEEVESRYESRGRILGMAEESIE